MERPRMEVNWTKPEDITKKGIYKVRVRPYRSLRIPVLPFRVEKRLLFASCNWCAKESIEENHTQFDLKCTHNITHRDIIGAWTSEELKLALSKGCTINYVYDIAYWKEWTKDNFRDFVANNLKAKIESSGVPASWSEEEKQAYKEQVKQKYGFEIDEQKWRKNPGLRQISKLFMSEFFQVKKSNFRNLLDASWGKFGQKQDHEELKICRTDTEVDELFKTLGLKVKHVELISDSVCLVKYKYRSGYHVENGFSNVALALWVTSMARIKLYKYMDQCLERGGELLYCDTGE